MPALAKTSTGATEPFKGFLEVLRENQKGKKMKTLTPLLAWCAIGLAALLASTFTFSGCANNQSAYQQISQQSNDPIDLAQALYVDAMDLYLDTGRIYKNYQALLIKEHPDLNHEILSLHNQMYDLLKQWRQLSGIARIGAIAQDSEKFHELRRRIIFELADIIEK